MELLYYLKNTYHSNNKETTELFNCKFMDNYIHLECGH